MSAILRGSSKLEAEAVHHQIAIRVTTFPSEEEKVTVCPESIEQAQPTRLNDIDQRNANAREEIEN